MANLLTYDEEVSFLNGDMVPFVDTAERIHYEGDLDKPAQEAFELEMETSEAAPGGACALCGTYRWRGGGFRRRWR